MNITELRYLVAIMKWGSVSAAAKQMYAAQPNVSKALKNLEEEYGIRIFERSSTGMIPTEQGRHFIRQAERVLDEVDRLDLDARSRQSSCAELRVVLAHAERYESFYHKRDWQHVADSPIMIQCNAAFFLRLRTRREALRLVKDGRIHLLGSDCHGAEHRAPNLDEAAQVIRKNLGEDALCEIDRLELRLLDCKGAE